MHCATEKSIEQFLAGRNWIRTIFNVWFQIWESILNIFRKMTNQLELIKFENFNFFVIS